MITIPQLTFDKRKDSTLEIGRLFFKKINIDIPECVEKERYLRVWVPENFNVKKKYGVIYMVDGQNAVDASLTAYGEWNIEEHLKVLTDNGYPEFIVVGIDCPKKPNERCREYTPYKTTSSKWKFLKNPYGEKFADFWVNKIVPFINARFNIDKDLVAFCGSSMGGLFSFSISAKYPEIFKFCLAFSPAFHPYLQRDIKKEFDKWIINNLNKNKYVFYIGGADSLENELKINTDYVYSLMTKAGFDENHIIYIYKDYEFHNEKAWSNVFIESMEFLLK